MSDRRLNRREAVRRLLVAAGLAALAVAVFLPVAGLGFVWDDFDYLHGNPLLAGGATFAGAARAFASFHSANWHPVTWLSHLADVALFGWAPAGHHAVNLLLHGANAALLFLLLAGVTGRTWPAAIATALFAVHPLRVESVAWVAERKDLLAALFGLGALLAYLGHARRPGWRRLAATGALLAPGLAAKPMLVSLPLLMLVLDWWPLGRRGAGAWGWRALVLEKLPFAILAAASAAITLAAQAAAGALDAYPFVERSANALQSYVAYLSDAFWPAGLAAFHPLRRVGLPVAAGAGALLALVTVVAVRTRRRQPWLLAGWAWYVVALVPVIGLVQVGAQARADRYTYLPLIGVLVAVVWSLAEVVRRRGRGRLAPAAAAAAAVFSLALVSRAQIPFWRDEIALWRRANQVSPGSSRALLNLGVALRKQGSAGEAEGALRAALSLADGDARTQSALGALLVDAGREREGAALLERALRGPDPPAEAALKLGVVRAGLGDLAGATALCRRAIELDRRLGAAHNNLGVYLAAQQDFAGAAAAFREALRLSPDDAGARRNLALALERGRGSARLP